MSQSNSKAGYFLLIVIAVLAIVILAIMMNEDREENRLSNAVEEINEGLEDAADEMDGNRSIGERMGDNIEEMGEDIQDATQ